MEIRLILIASTLIVGCGSIGLFVVRSAAPSLRGLGWLASAYLSGMAGTLLLTMDGRVPTFCIILANTLTLLAYFLFHCAILDLTASKRRFSWLSVLWISADLALSIFFTYFHNSHQIRVTYGSVLLACQTIQSGLLFVRQRHLWPRAPVWFMAIVLFGFSAFNIFRGFVTALHGIPEGLLVPSRMQIVSVIVFLTSALGFGFGFFWMTTTHLPLAPDHLGSLDPLTGASVWRIFQLDCEKERARSLRSGEPFSLLLVDLDHLRQINDRFGRPTGDSVVRLVADHIRSQLRASDTLGHRQGREFAILLPSCSLKTALEVAERLRQGISELRLNRSGKSSARDSFQVTASLGATAFRGESDSLDVLFDRSDAALLQAKAAGRNRVLANP